MKCLLKGILALMTVLLLCCGCRAGQEAPSLTAVSQAGIKLTGEGKRAFTETVSVPQNPFQGDLTELLLALPAAGETLRETLLAQLEALGVYEYIGRPVSTSALHTPQVLLAPPSVFYNSVTGEWYVLCGGQWLDTAWTAGLPQGDLKMPDGFGVVFEFTAGYNAHVTDARAVLWNEDGSNKAETDQRPSGDGAKGFDFTLQDRMESSGFLGHRWAGLCVYSPEFVDCSAELTAYYRHD